MLLVALMAAIGTLDAQIPTSGVLVGTVRDMSGAVIAGAHVALRNTATAATREQDSGASGNYAFPNVTPGSYTVTVTRTGFREAAIQEFTVDVNKSYTVDVPLEVGP